ncbi:hypothetical protein ACSSWA_06730 [Melioribacter sp. Ez-97]|uniref:hypothetical protein n=1 Tax=Melioribacter sp. Ez-97 TaxID=3423434 RepID=UPI003ED8D330
MKAVIIILLSFIQVYSQSEVEKAKTVLILPFYEREFNVSSELYHSLKTGFMREDYIVLSSDSVWNKLDSLDISFNDIDSEIADSIKKIIDCDLIVYGRIDEDIKPRTSPAHDRNVSYKPFIIKVYDTRSQSLVLYERMELINRWGLFSDNTEIHDIGYKTALKLRTRGY